MDQNGSMTAKLCLFARAVHAQEGNPVFNDTKAGELLEQKDYDHFSRMAGLNEEGIGRYDERMICRHVDCWFSPILTARSCFAEEHVMNLQRQYGRIQYVILGAGMDTFAYREGNPSIEVFELDHPFTQNYKKRRIQELGWKIPDNLHYMTVDFAKDSLSGVLRQSEYDSGLPTVFSILGLTYYLSLDTFALMLKEIASIAGNRDEIIFDYPDTSGFHSSSDSRMKELSKATALMGERMTGGFTEEEILSALASNGFRIAEHMSPDDIQQKWFAKDQRIQAFHCIHLVMAEQEKPEIPV